VWRYIQGRHLHTEIIPALSLSIVHLSLEESVGREEEGRKFCLIMIRIYDPAVILCVMNTVVDCCSNGSSGIGMGGTRTGLIWLRLGTGGGHLKRGNEPSGSVKCGKFLD
jgi:hypothetical protein